MRSYEFIPSYANAHCAYEVSNAQAKYVTQVKVEESFQHLDYFACASSGKFLGFLFALGRYTQRLFVTLRIHSGLTANP